MIQKSAQELHHEIFGSVLDRTEMTPFLLLRTQDYPSALSRASLMMGNRGFDVGPDGSLYESEQRRAQLYIERVYRYCLDWLFPFVRRQLEMLASLGTQNLDTYRACLEAMQRTGDVLTDAEFRALIADDARHLFLLASSRKYPRVFAGYRNRTLSVPPDWQRTACAMLKVGHLVKSVEEDSQDINDYAQLGFYLEQEGQNLDDLYRYDWDSPQHIPDGEAAQRAFIKISAFFHKLKESLHADSSRGCLIFNSGDGVEVDIMDIKARLKSPESMFTKLGKDLEGEAYDIRDILAVTFILRDMDDTLKLVHALQKRGVILQENTASHSITQTLYDAPGEMRDAVRRLMISLSRSEGRDAVPDESELLRNAETFYEALSVNAARNRHSSLGHRKFQCKIAFSLPIHRSAETNELLVPGTAAYEDRDRIEKRTQQHTLGVELRISDEQSWSMSEWKGDSHHDAYKFRQLVSVMNRIFRGVFHLPEDRMPQLRKDQALLFP